MVLFTPFAFSQYKINTYNGQTATTCSGTFFDSGGSSGNYGANENYTVTFFSGSSCKQLILTFTSLDIESGYDILKIYDGSSTSAPLIKETSGSTVPAPIVSSSGYLTINFTSDNSVQNDGWQATIACLTSLSYNTGCTSASLVYPVSGANFSFSTPPGDGATIDASTGKISNATMGATYHIYDACSNRSGSITMKTEPCFNLFGVAQPISVGGNTCIQLTPKLNDKIGCAWSESTVEFNSSFSLSLDYFFGDNPNGADGTTCTFQPNSLAPCGENGSQLGVGGMPKALVVEFDTYDNDDTYNHNDPSCDHIAKEIDGELVRDDWNTSPPLCGPVCAKSDWSSIENNSTHHVEIK